ncbi:MAG: nucleoside-diphosphate sugar epimerase/dehydratase [Pseudomonadota bacterium]
MMLHVPPVDPERLSRRQKRYLFFTLDVLLIPVALYFAFALRHGRVFPAEHIAASWILFPVLMAAGAWMIWAKKLPKIKLMAFDIQALRMFASVSVGLVGLSVIVSYAFGLSAPRSIPLIFGAVFLLALILIRLTLLAALEFLARPKQPLKPVAIYGAGTTGIQLLSVLRKSGEYQPMLFVDDNPTLKGLIISGLEVLSPSNLSKLVSDGVIDRVFIAIPSARAAEQKQIAARLTEAGINVQILPSYVDLIAGLGSENKLRTIGPDELLGRDKVDLNIPTIAMAYADKSVMVTGAGGSIGSELCRQLIGCKPAKLILFEQNEFALYSIEQELAPLASEHGITLCTRLGSVTNASRVASVLKDQEVDTVLHAAAYKHVPLVEDNELEGARNNVLGTQRLAEACAQAKVERFILVSTDKAVRPTNVMGATKRMAELVVQDLQTRTSSTRFAMVRFGNVLGSSGSVLPLFQRQIRAGGPVTVTHPEVTRFFMTIPEAARLVLLAGAFAEGGDVFVLDMGQPMKIVDIAQRMIEMTGHRVKEHPDEDDGIAIEITGLRPGEKLYEELLIDDKSLVGTPHPKILRASENRLSEIEVAGMIKEISEAIERGDEEAFRNCMSRRVDGYQEPEITKLTLPGE